MQGRCTGARQPRNPKATATERGYVRPVLPRAALRGPIPGRPGGQPGLPTAATVLCGLAFTASGYLRGGSRWGAARCRMSGGSDRHRAGSAYPACGCCAALTMAIASPIRTPCSSRCFTCRTRAISSSP
jgi:hypothetical protein